jgi:NAD(P)-dependent dehydrogenase (short-subunit alcohol dehydrogenase family)
MTELPLSGRSALVTAGGTGIGFACAARLVADGATVTIVARRAEVLAEAADRLRAAGPADAEVLHTTCDVTDEAQVAAAVARAAEPTGGVLHHVVASAGGGTLGPIHKTSLEEWNQVLATNLTGTFLTFKHAAGPTAAADGASMVAISSTAGAQVHPMLGPYGVSKAGVDMLVRHLADELGPFGVRVNAVRPGIVETEMMEIPMQAPGLVDDYLAQMPLGRVGRPDDVAEAVRYLLGPESSWMTGVTLDIDGGMHLRRAASYEHLARAFFGEDGTRDLLAP